MSRIVHTMQFSLTYIVMPVKNEHGATGSFCRADSEVLKRIQGTLYIGELDLQVNQFYENACWI